MFEFYPGLSTTLNLAVSNFAHSTLVYCHTLTLSHPPLTPSHSHTHSHCHTLTLTLTAGTASHSLDYRKAAGAFIHGFRYSGTVL